MAAVKFLDGKVTLHSGDCLAVLKKLAANSIDSVVTDPPYHLTSIVKRFGSVNAAPAKVGKSGAYARASKGFMGKVWDGGDIAFRPELWAEVLRVLKPGGHLVSFGGTRTYHRMACAIEDAGFEVRDMVSWLYGSGFPKSHDVSKGIDKTAGAKRSKVKTPAKHGIGSANTVGGDKRGAGRPWIDAALARGFHEHDSNVPATIDAQKWEGWGTALKPACEPIVLARKPLSEGTVAANVLKWGTGAINVDGCRIGTAAESFLDTRAVKKNDVYGKFNPADYDGSKGRWPANVVHDGSAEVVGAFPDAGGGSAIAHNIKSGVHFGDSGSAARFFYSAKADADDRLGSKHPTVKPVDLMQYFCRLITPRGGVCLDPFAGTGTTGEAAWREGMRAVLIERENEYCEYIRRRMSLAKNDPIERKRVAKNPTSTPQETLF